jgi:uncharacterized membrane protein
MQESSRKILIQWIALLAVIVIALVTSGFPLLLVVGVTLLLFAVKKEISNGNKIFAWASSIFYLTVGLLIMIYLLYMAHGNFPYNDMLPRWLDRLWDRPIMF